MIRCRGAARRAASDSVGAWFVYPHASPRLWAVRHETARQATSQVTRSREKRLFTDGARRSWVDHPVPGSCARPRRGVSDTGGRDCSVQRGWRRWASQGYPLRTASWVGSSSVRLFSRCSPFLSTTRRGPDCMWAEALPAISALHCPVFDCRERLPTIALPIFLLTCWARGGCLVPQGRAGFCTY